jgi:hypothetical protein
MFLDLKNKKKIMTDPRFFRQYLDILDEQDTASIDLGNTKFSLDKSTVSGQLDVDDKTQVTAQQDLSQGGASTVGAKTNIDGVDISAQKSSPAYNKGQLAGTSSVSAAYKDAQGYLGKPGQTHTVTATKGVGFGGVGKDIRPGQNIATSYTKS